MSKSGSKFLTGLIAFLLGFIFAVLVEIGAVVGVYFYVTKTDLDVIFNTLGIQNKDEDGNYIYINTDKNNGGAQNVGELFSALYGYLYSEGSSVMDYPVLGKSLGDISNLLPVVQNTLATKLYPMVSEFADVDWEEFEKVSISELPQFLSGTVMDIRPAAVLERLGMNGLVGPDANALVNALIAGAEFDYAYTETNLKFPVYYDTYTFNEDLNGFYRDEASDGRQSYPFHLSKDLLYNTDTKNDDGKTVYRLYFIPCAVNGNKIADAPLAGEGDTIYAEGTTFIAVQYDADEDKYILDLDFSNPAQYLYPDYYGYHNIDRTGNFYYTNDGGNELQIYPVTIGSFADPDEVFKPLYCTRITEIMEGDIIVSMFGNHSVGELLDGKIDIDECVNNLELAKVINIDPEEDIMAYIGFGLTGVKEVDDGRYTGFVDVEGVSTQCFITSALEGEPARRNITRVWYNSTDGNGNPVEIEVKGTKVKEVSSIATAMELTALLDVKADDAILCYLGYGLSGVVAQEGNGYTHVGKCDILTEDGSVEEQVYINTGEDGLVTEVWYLKDGVKETVPGTTVNRISDRISSLTDKLTLPDVLDISAEQTITAYIGYGITHIAEAAGDGYSHTADYKLSNGNETQCYIATDETGKITSVWYMENGVKKFITGTVISGLPDKIDGISEELTLADVMDISQDDSILWALRNAKICDIGKEVKNLKVSDVLEEEDINKSAILRQLRNKTIDELSTAIDAISIQSIYSKEIYGLESENKDPEEVTEYKENIMYFTQNGEGVFTYVNNAYANDEDDSNDDLVGVLSKEEYEAGIANGIKYYSYGEAKGMWRLILFKNDREKVYTLNNFNNMVNTCTGNIYNAKLKTLQEADIIDNEKDLSKTLVWYSKEADGTYKRHDGETLADITLKRLIEIVLEMEFPSLPTT